MLSLPRRKTKFWNDSVSYLLGDTKIPFLLEKENKMKVNPIRDRILIKPLDAETVTKSGILIPDAAKEKSVTGKVIGVGTGKLTEDGQTVPLVVKQGDTVMYSQYSGQKVKINDEEHLILKEDEVMAIVE